MDVICGSVSLTPFFKIENTDVIKVHSILFQLYSFSHSYAQNPLYAGSGDTGGVVYPAATSPYQQSAIQTN